jgi:ABC-type multidrug transport system ATPase subunit
MQLEVETLGKYYGALQALRGVSFAAGPGLLGLVGPNGAGKTTLMRILAGLLKADEGQVRWNGERVRAEDERFRSRLGYLPQDFGVYPSLSARQFLEYMATLKGLKGPLAKSQVEKVLEEVNLQEKAGRPLKEFSQGMKQRVGIAQALLNDPELLIVDEPTAGLDPEERMRFRALLVELAAQRLVLLSTHIIADVEAAAQRLILLRKGALLMDTTSDALTSAAQGRVWSVKVDSELARELRQKFTCSQAVLQKDGILLRLIGDQTPHPEAQKVDPSLEEAYLVCMQAQG